MAGKTSTKRKTKIALLPDKVIASRILMLNGQNVMIDRDLAELYGVTTFRLNEQVKRNRTRFPPDFMRQITPAEKEYLIKQYAHL